jgi:DNA mismatch repair protein MLH1
VAKELLNIMLESEDKVRRRNDRGDADDAEFWSAEVHFTNANYQAKKMVFLLFINRTSIHDLSLWPIISWSRSDRLVESPRMKRALEAVYSGVLPKGSFPFIYLR